MLRDYYLLTKPGIIRGNLLIAGASFVYASNRGIDYWQLLLTLAGICLIIASACVYNNYLDRKIDAKMERTKERSLVTNRIRPLPALIFGGAIGVIGFLVLVMLVNVLTAVIGLFGWLMYVLVYGYFKRVSVYGTAVGSISGALPPVAGYTAAVGAIDAPALWLFGILVLWQMAHFYSIAIYRIKDYKRAKIPVMPAVRGVARTKLEICIYIAVLGFACIFFGLKGYVALIFSFITAGYVAGWLGYGLIKYSKLSGTVWAKKMFLLSLGSLPIIAAMLIINPYL